jgi:hypothetical protein
MLLTTFVGTLAAGAVTGWLLEQQYGMKMVRWYRGHLMRMRIDRRQGD